MNCTYGEKPPQTRASRSLRAPFLPLQKDLVQICNFFTKTLDTKTTFCHSWCVWGKVSGRRYGHLDTARRHFDGSTGSPTTGFLRQMGRLSNRRATLWPDLVPRLARVDGNHEEGYICKSYLPNTREAS